MPARAVKHVEIQTGPLPKKEACEEAWSSVSFQKETRPSCQMLRIYHKRLPVRLRVVLKPLIIKHKLNRVWLARCYHSEWICSRLPSPGRLSPKASDSILVSTATFGLSPRRLKPASFFAAWTSITFPSKRRAT